MYDIEKVNWNIGEVALILKVATSKIRHWEKEFPWTTPFKSKRGGKGKPRKYDKQEVLELANIHYLVEECGLSLRGIRLAHEGRYMEDLLNFFNEKNARIK